MLGCVTLALCITVFLVALGPAIGRIFEAAPLRQYCVEFFDDTSANGIQDAGESALRIPGAKVDELHSGQIYATYSADECAPMHFVEFDVEVVLPSGYAPTAPLVQNLDGHYDDKLYTFRFGVQPPSH